MRRSVFAFTARWAGKAWAFVRAVSGDDAYERYLAHQGTRPAARVLTRKDFFADRQRRKWSGVTRCC